MTAKLAPLAIGMMAGGQIGQGISANASARANAALADSEAMSIRRDGVAEVAARRDEARRIAGEAIAAMGSSGLALGTGSFLDVLRDNAIEAELDLLTVRTNAEARARARELDAENSRQAGRMALVQGILGGVSSVVSGVQGGAFGSSAVPRVSGGLNGGSGYASTAMRIGAGPTFGTRTIR